jgi:nucleoside phosphorylase
MTASLIQQKVVLVAGSASDTCPTAKLEVAHAFVQALTRQVLEKGGGFVLFASGEPTTHGGIPLIFDWTVLREIDEYLAVSGEHVRRCVTVVTSHKAWSTKMPEAHRQVLGRLSGTGAAEVIYVDDDVHTGGNIGDEQVGRASAMIALGGGKGVNDRAHKMMRQGCPVLPMDLSIGALSGDGDGATGLHKKLLAEPQRFFPLTAAHVRSYIPSLSLDVQGADVEAVAMRTVELLAAELDAARANGPIDVTVLTALPIELAAMHAALGLSPVVGESKTPAGTTYWTAEVQSQKSSRALRVCVCSIGGAGNPDAAAAATELATLMRPRLVMMVGIAAGLRGKCRLGEVVVSDRVVAYEPAAAAVVEGVSTEVPRPEAYRVAHSIQQDVTSYLADAGLQERLLQHPVIPAGAFPGVEADLVAKALTVRSATIASGEKLLRDPANFQAIRALHGKIEIVEMEAAGVATACHRSGASFLVVRGISDFGDGSKDDRFHNIAAKGAAVIAVDLIREGLHL